MERPIKGGYILISLGLIALSASAELSLDYERITKTKKHIVLTGIKVGDEIMPDVCVDAQMTEDGILFSDVYGFDILVAEDNSVTVSEHEQPSGGTKFYKHIISLEFDSGEGGSYTLSFMTTNPQAYTQSTLKDIKNDNPVLLPSMYVDNAPLISAIILNENTIMGCYLSYDPEGGTIVSTFRTSTYTLVRDTVTEL